MKSKSLVIIGAFALLPICAFGAAEKKFISYNSEYSYRMLDHTTEINRKQLALLKMRQSELIGDGEMLMGANMIVLADLQESNREAKFGYLMRHPTQNNQGGKSASEFVIHSAQLQVTGAMNSWLTMYFQLLYNPEQSFGAGTITTLSRNQVQLRRGYVLIGDLDECPFYASIGKMATPFGLTDTVNPFSASTVWHVFAGLAYGAQLGYHSGGLDVAIMGIQGGAQFRATHSGDDTPDDVANFSAAAAYTMNVSDETTVRIGAGYVDGTAYCQGFPITHFSGCEGFHNPAVDLNIEIISGRLKIIGEFAETEDPWPGTHNPSPPLDVFAAHDVTAFDIGASYLVTIPGIPRDVDISVDFSQFETGPSGSPWEDQSQFVIGLEAMVNEHAKIFAEYIHTEGYAPLNFISGPDPFDPTEDPGTTHSDNGAESDIFLVGMQVAI